jgi:hypothetical protein
LAGIDVCFIVDNKSFETKIYRKIILNMVVMKPKTYQICVLLFQLIARATSSPQVNHKIYSEEDLLAIDSSPSEVIDQLAVETVNDAQGTVVLPPPDFKPTGEKQ